VLNVTASIYFADAALASPLWLGRAPSLGVQTTGGVFKVHEREPRVGAGPRRTLGRGRSAGFGYVRPCLLQ
jgi:hypothetical protein